MRLRTSLRAGLAAVAVIAAMAAPVARTAAASTSAGRAHAATAALPHRVPCPGCWRPPLRVSWQWQLQSPPPVSRLLDVQMYDIDAFDAPRSLVRTMHARGMHVVCYISAGTWEKWRPDAKRFPAVVKGNPDGGWPGERWLDIRRLDILRPLMRERIQRCARKGFDGVEFDNVDAYTNDGTGFDLTSADQLRYNVFLADAAHHRGLAAFLKNDLDQIPTLLPYFDAALNEQCFQYAECGKLNRFVEAGKPVFGVEYSLPVSSFCPRANARNFNFLKKHLALGPWRIACR